MKEGRNISCILVERGVDGNGTKISKEALESLAEQDVLVNWSFDTTKPMGTAKTKINEDGHLEVTISLYPDELLPEGSKEIIDKLFPAIGGSITHSHQVGDVRVINKMKITGVSLSPNPNADPSIKSIGEQTKNP